MINSNPKLIACLSALLLFFSQFASAQATGNGCPNPGITIGFFNGVLTSPLEAEIAKQELRMIHGSRVATGETISYVVFYNRSNVLEDFVETYDQRLQEQEGLLAGRFELFFESTQGGGDWSVKIRDAIPSVAGVLDGMLQVVQAHTLQRLRTLFANPPTTVDYADHRQSIDNLVLANQRLLFVAHSQGNLFVNPAYDYALTKTTAQSVRVVHVAPASPRLVGPHTLADLDLVINALRSLGSVGAVTDLIPGYLVRPAGLWGGKDPLGHGLLEIYLNPALSTAARVKGHINSAMGDLVSQPNSCVLLDEQFEGTGLNPGTWNLTGAGSVANGVITFSQFSTASTNGKKAFAGSKIVVEGRFGGLTANGRDTHIELIDSASGHVIQFGDTSYFGWGMYIQCTGSYNLTGVNENRGASTGGINMSTNGSSSSAYKYYRFTIDGANVTVQRGDVPGIYNEMSGPRIMSTSIVGRAFYLRIGTGAAAYSPGTFDWVKVSAAP